MDIIKKETNTRQKFYSNNMGEFYGHRNALFKKLSPLMDTISLYWSIQSHIYCYRTYTRKRKHYHNTHIS